MTTAQIGLFAVIAYAMAFVCQVADSKNSVGRLFLFFLSWLAIITHGLQLHLLIDLPLGQNLSWVNLLSLLTWLTVLLIGLASVALPVKSLNLLVYPVAIIAVGLSEILHPYFLIATKYQPEMLMHILLATLIVALLVICGIQALLLIIQQRALKQKKLLSLLQLFPPLQVMEHLLFFEMSLGFLGLTLFLLLSLVSFNFELLKIFWLEAALSCLLWLIFLFLLIGRFILKWRSATAAIWVSFGVSVAVILYLTSHIK